VTQVRSLGRPVEVLALIAGVGVAGPFVDTPLDDDLRLIALNVTSVVHAAKVAAADGAAGAGAVLVTSSVAATMPGPWYATYAASKAFALLRLSRPP
jgi:short-subunit dehydrogenase